MLRELLASFSVDTGQAVGALQKIDGAITGAKVKLGALASAFVGSAIVAGLSSFVEGQIEAAKETRLMAQKLGTSVDELEKFEFAAGAAGVSSEGAGVALKFLNKNVGLAIEGNAEAAQTFQKLGIAYKDGSGEVREVGDLIPEVADAFAKMGSQQERTAAAMKLFGRQGADLLPLLQGGSAGLAQMNKRFEELGGGMSEDFIAKAKDAGRALSGMRFGFAAFKRQIALELFPYVTAFGQAMQGVVGFLNKVTKNSHLAAEAATILGIAAGVAGLKAAAGFAQFLGVVPKDAGFWKTALGLGEILLVVAGLAILFLAFEDFFAMLNGDQSIIGTLMDQFLGLGSTNELVAELQQSWALLSGLFATDLTSLEPLVGLFKDLAKDILPYAVASFVDLVRIIAGGVTLLAAFVKTLAQVGSFDFKAAGKTIEATTKSVFGEGGILSKSAVGDLAIHSKAKAGAPVEVGEALHTSGRQGGATTVNQTNKIEVNVDGGSNPRETGAAVKDGARGAVDGSLRDAFGAVGTGG